MDLQPHQPVPYRVLARTYRPQRLSQLIGQDALVRTLKNAMLSGRVAHAFLLAGIRGIGKTTTARIIARGLNCTGADGSGGPTPEPCSVCESCRAIAEDRSIDVIEMDAATRTGIDDIREIVESVRYGPAAARYKVYIIDEVHMLSEKAFNGLLKTLEEPPPHAKFIFATTEVRKVPVTVLSRCQRFDLKRVDTALLERHLEDICGREGIEAEPAALSIIVRAAEGSVRDSLSLLDQAMALEDGVGETPVIRATTVEDMLGLADRERLLDLFEEIIKGEAANALDGFRHLYALGADPAAVLQDLLDISHWLSCLAAGRDSGSYFAILPNAETRALALARRLSTGLLARFWQILLKGLEEVRLAADAAVATEMIIIRLCCLAELPPPSDLARMVREGDRATPSAGALSTREPAPDAPAPSPVAVAPSRSALLLDPAPQPETVRPEPQSFRDLVALLSREGERALAAWLHQGAHLVSFEPPRLSFRPAANMPADLANRLKQALDRLTSESWGVIVVGGPGEPTLAEQDAQEKERLKAAVADDPAVREVLARFPGARVVDVRERPRARALPHRENEPLDVRNDELER